MHFKDLLNLLHSWYGTSTFYASQVSGRLLIFAATSQEIHLVDNPKGLTTKWISNDLNRLRLMSFLNRKREKRPVLGIAGDQNRGFHYAYRISNSGLRYLDKMERAGYKLPAKCRVDSPEDVLEQHFFQLTESAGPRFELEKAAERQSLRIMSDLSTNEEDYDVMKLLSSNEPNSRQYLAAKDRMHRRTIGFRRRFGMHELLRRKDEQIAELQLEVMLLKRKLGLLPP